MSSIKLEIKGIEILQKLLKQFPKEIRDTLSAAGREAAEKVILPEEGLKKYPPATGANAPGRIKPPNTRIGYYVRGRGFQSPIRGGGYKSLGNSERYGSQWYVKRVGYGTEIGNRASYAKWLGSESQAKHMGALGWRKIKEVAEEKISEITNVYQLWVDRLIAKLTKKA